MATYTLDTSSHWSKDRWEQQMNEQVHRVWTTGAMPMRYLTLSCSCLQIYECGRFAAEPLLRELLDAVMRVGLRHLIQVTVLGKPSRYIIYIYTHHANLF